MASLRQLAPCGLILLAFPLLPATPAWGFSLLVMCAAAAAVAVGVRRNRPERALPWWIAAAGVAGIALSTLLGLIRHVGVEAPWPMVVDKAPNVAGLVAIVVAIVALMRARRQGVDRDGAVDAVAVILAGGLAWWELGHSSDDPFASIDVLRSLLLLAVAVVIARAGLWRTSNRPPSLVMVLAAAGVATVTRGWDALAPESALLDRLLIDPLELAAIWLIGAAALHPSMRELGRPAGESPRGLSPLRMVALGAALLANPLLVLLWMSRHGGGDLVLAAGVCVLTLLVLWRIGGLLAERERGRRHQELVARIGAAAVTRISAGELLATAAADTADTLRLGHALTVEDDRLVVGGADLDPDQRACLTSVSVVLAAALEQRSAEAAMRHQALHDSLTGLPNRALLLDRLEHALAGSDRTAGNVAVLFVDLDRFKRVNDRFGHAAGDALLLESVARMRGLLRPGDTLARLAGDEFVAICEDVGEIDASVIADRIVDGLSRPFQLAGGEVRIGASVGVALAEDGDSPDAALSRADAAMYRAKHGGRGRAEVCAYS